MLIEIEIGKRTEIVKGDAHAVVIVKGNGQDLETEKGDAVHETELNEIEKGNANGLFTIKEHLLSLSHFYLLILISVGFIMMGKFYFQFSRKEETQEKAIQILGYPPCWI